MHWHIYILHQPDLQAAVTHKGSSWESDIRTQFFQKVNYQLGYCANFIC